MRKLGPLALAGLVPAFSVVAASVLTRSGGLRRSTALLVLAVALAAPIAAYLRRSHGVAAAAAMWLAIAPLAEAIRRVMGRSIQAFQTQISSGWWSPQPLQEWRLDTPIVHGFWPLPPLVALVWALVGACTAAVVWRWHERLRGAIVAFAWGVTALSFALVCATLHRESRRDDVFSWARALPQLPRPERLASVPRVCEPQWKSEMYYGSSDGFDVHYQPCTFRLARGDSYSGFLSVAHLDRLTLHHDPRRGVDVVVMPDAVSLLQRDSASAVEPPVTRIPREHRIVALCTTTLALALLAWPRRRRATAPSEPDAPYRPAPAPEPLRDDELTVRAAAAASLALLGSAPVIAWWLAGLG